MSDLPTFDEWLETKIREVRLHAPTMPPYRVEIFNETRGLFYVSGASCNALGNLSFTSCDFAHQVAVRANEIASSP